MTGPPPEPSPAKPAAGASIAWRTARGAAWVAAWRAFTRVIGLASTVILVRLLEPSDFGLVAIATGMIALTEALSSVEAQEALIRERVLTKDLYDTGFTMTVLRGLVTAAAIVLLAHPAAHFFNEPRLFEVMLALGCGIVLSSCESIRTVDFARDLAFQREFWLQAASRIVAVSVTIGTAIIWRTYWALVVGLLAGRVTRLVQSYVMAPYRPRLTLSQWRRIIGFSMWTWGNTILIQARDRAEQMTVGRIIGGEAVGLFSVGVEIGKLATTEMLAPLIRALFPGFAALNHDPQSQRDMYLDAVAVGLLLILPIGVGMSLLAHPVVLLCLGPRWTDTIPMVQVLGVVSGLIVFSYVGSTLLSAIGSPNISFGLLALAVSIRIPLVIVMTAWWGLVGAAGAMAVSLLLDQLIYQTVVCWKLRLPIGSLISRVWRPIVGCAVMAGGLYELGLAWTAPAGTSVLSLLWECILTAVTGGTIFAATMVVLWGLSGWPDGAERRVISVARRVVRL